MTPKLKAFFERLDAYEETLPLDVLRTQLEQLDLSLDDLGRHVAFGQSQYQRNRLHIGPGYHALALCWGPGQHSVIHNHEGSGCGFLVVSGTATETLYTLDDAGRLKRGTTRTHEPGTVRVSVDADIHRMGNDDRREGLVTLHIYSPPLLEAVTYEEGTAETGRWTDPILDELSSRR